MASSNPLAIHDDIRCRHLFDPHSAWDDSRRGKQNKPMSGSSNTALAAKGVDESSNPNCKAKKCSTHSTANCYWPRGGKERQFPSNFGQRARANAASSNQSGVEHFVLAARIPDTPGNSGIIVGENDDEVITMIALISKSQQRKVTYIYRFGS